MKIKKFCFIFFFIFFISSGFCQTVNYNLLLSKKFKELKYIQKVLKSLKLLEKDLLKLYINIHIKNLFNEKELLLNINKSSFLETEDFEIIENILLKKIIAIKQKEKFLKSRYKIVSKEIKKLKILQAKSLKQKLQQEDIAYPIKNGKIKSGSYVFKITKPTKIKCPISGIVKVIGYKENNISIIIENENCTVYLKNLDDIKVNVGDYVNTNEIIGSINKPKKFKISINCKN